MRWLGYAIAAACLVWVFHGIDFGELGQRFLALDWRYAALAVAADLAIYVCGGWRWSVLLEPIAKVSFWRSVQSIYIGLFANEILPLRTGELIRCYLLSYWSLVPLSNTLSSAAIERLLDGLWIVIAFLVTSLMVTLPGYMVDGARALGVVLLLIFALLGAVVVGKHRARSLVSGSRWVATLHRIIDGLHAMGNRRTMFASFGISMLYLLLNIISVWALIQADSRLNLGFWAASTVLIIRRLGTVVPNAPGDVGTAQFFYAQALMLFGVAEADAKGFSFILFGVLTLPLLLGGFLAVALTGLKFGEIRKRAQQGAQAAGVAAPSEDAGL